MLMLLVLCGETVVIELEETGSTVLAETGFRALAETEPGLRSDK